MKFWRVPLDRDKVKVPRGDVVILPDRCKGCTFCVTYCPRDCLAMSESFNVKGYHPPEVVKPEACVCCRLCEMICPEFAIYPVQQSGDGVAPDFGDPSEQDSPADETKAGTPDG